MSLSRLIVLASPPALWNATVSCPSSLRVAQTFTCIFTTKAGRHKEKAVTDEQKRLPASCFLPGVLLGVLVSWWFMNNPGSGLRFFLYQRFKAADLKVWPAPVLDKGLPTTDNGLF